MKRIYFDHSATTPLDPKVLRVMSPYFTETFGNASSIHNFGQEALAGVDAARRNIASYLKASPDDIIFTSGATESDNLAIKGFIKAWRENNKNKIHVITSLVEHDAVLEPFMELEKEGVEVTHIKVSRSGVVDLDHFKASLKDNTVLVSLMWVNSEVGSIMPIKNIGGIISKWNEKRTKDWKKLPAGKRGDKPGKVYFHTDATQALNFIVPDVEENHIDLLSMSAHKIYGPKGVGILYRREGTPLKALQRGGHHERDFRSGTLNVTGIVGLGEAVKLLNDNNRESENIKLAKLRDRLADGIIERIPDVILNTDREHSTPAHAHFSFIGVEGEAILMSLDLEHGIAVSTGSACASGSLKASHVLIAMGIKKEIAHNSIRFSLGKNNTETDVDKLLEVLPPIIEKYRKMNPLYKK